VKQRGKTVTSSKRKIKKKLTKWSLTFKATAFALGAVVIDDVFPT